MTGFGKCVGTVGTKKFSIEVKSLNSKQLDITMRMPGIYREKELELRGELSSKLDRGKVDVSIFFESNGEEAPTNVNKELALSYHKQLKDIAAVIGEEDSDMLPILLRMPDVLKAERQELDEEEWASIKALVFGAVDELVNYRTAEGKVLENDFRQRITTILSLLDEVAQHEGERMESIKERIQKSLKEVGSEEKIDQNRYEQELIYYLEKIDITEEKVRLKSNCDYFLETLDSEKAQGKKLGFIGQEIGREINTLGSKANHAHIQRIVVQMKDELEKIKEQVLNVL